MIKIAIASGKGGTGKTLVATNIFNGLIKKKYDSVLIDCDAEAPNAAVFFEKEHIESVEITQLIPVIDTKACTYCGKCYEYCNYNAIFILPPVRIINVIEDLCHGCGACSVACKDGAITEKPTSLGKVNIYSTNKGHLLIEARMNIGVMSPVPVIKAAIKQIKNFDGIVILDSPPGTSCPFIQTVSQSDYVILVTEPTPFGLSDLKQSVETLKTINKPCGVIINRTGMGDNKVMDYIKSENIPLLMEIPFKQEIAEIYAGGKLVTDNDELLEKQLLAMINKINENYGDSNN
ncbi:MAG: ATP-binding protein [Bacteroidales bacterium]|jgi:MinD superfamily P-loop ATPase|nr:ATP-binding protein [Bacteroidales bacterium]